jgi:Laminin G domain
MRGPYPSTASHNGLLQYFVWAAGLGEVSRFGRGTAYRTCGMAFFRGECLAFGRCALIGATVLFGTAYTGVESAFAATIARWEMNEGTGAGTMRDSSGSSLSGAIGSAVQTGVRVGSATGYRWSSQNRDGSRPERLVRVASSRLNPGTRGFVVIVRLRTGAGDHNIIQKGQARTGGGMFKVDMVRGHVICTFKGSVGRVAIGSRRTLHDGAWHTVRCERRSGRVTIVVDDGSGRTKLGRAGRIANNWALSIGGKLHCNPPRVGCDYYVGVLDRAVVKRP